MSIASYASARRTPARRSARNAFTLVELLVVIGIIAVLISILLPTLSTARRQAARTKCAAQLREIGNAFALYSIDNKGYWPLALRQCSATNTYSLYNHTFDNSSGPYWTDFLSKYVTKSKVGVSSQTNAEAANAKGNVLWGCPEWTGYQSTTLGGINRVQTGFGMNLWPTFKPGYPTTNFPPTAERNAFFLSDGLGQFFKQVRWTKPAQRALVADSRFWAAESNPCPPLASDPTKGDFPYQSDINNTYTYTNGVQGQTMVDVYRHGKHPKRGPVANTFDKKGGKVAYNLLYCDGHVVTEIDQRAAYEAFRMRFPK
jgi:prepilin-type N-terminal cleavage/methylation domain-containing protein/prepilin-type processing-associated H-X9-DG protein